MKRKLITVRQSSSILRCSQLGKHGMTLKVAKLQMLRESMGRFLVLRVFMFISALALFPFMQFVARVDPMQVILFDSSACAFNRTFHFGRYFKPLTFYTLPLLEPHSPSLVCDADVNFTSVMFRELMDMKLLASDAKALCLGDGSIPAVTALRSLGISSISGINRFPFISTRSFFNKLSYDDDSFDFVYSSGLDSVPVPALLVLEIERILKPGGICAMLAQVPDATPGTLIKAATPISSFLKSSDIVHVGTLDQFTFIVFKKSSGFNSFEHCRLPEQCASVENNKPYMEYLEPLLEEKSVGTGKRFNYLTEVMNISDRNRAIYIDLGAEEFVDSSIANWFLPLYPMQSRSFDIVAMSHNSSVLLSYARRHDITFVYYPELSERPVSVDSDHSEEIGHSFVDDVEGPELFDFLAWFKETVRMGDFVVMKMRAEGVGLELLHELFKSGSICLIDELFLHCSNSMNVRNADGGGCFQLLEAIRNKGIYAHQWVE